MSRTSTLYIDLKRLARLDDAGLVIRLMMVCNDVSVANAKLGEAYHEQDPEQRDWGATVYFQRLEVSHMHEAMSIIEDVNSRPSMRGLLSRCSERCRTAFEVLASCLRGGANSAKFKSHTILRNTVGFHYGEKLVQKALLDRASTAKKPSTTTTSNDVRKIRYKLADDILGTLMVHQIWGAHGAEMNDKLDEVLQFLDCLVRALLEFGGEFITIYLRENASL